MITVLAAIVIMLGFLALCLGVALSMCMVARDADEWMSERARACREDEMEQTYRLPACEARVHGERVL